MALILCLGLACGQTDKSPATAFRSSPQLKSTHVLTDGADTLAPVRLQMIGDTLAVSYNGVPRIDLYDAEMVRVGSIDLVDPVKVHPTAFYIDDSLLVVADHARHVIVIYDREGKLLESFGTLPDGKTPLAPLAMTVYGGIAYVADMAQKAVLAVSLVDAGELTERGELILTIPADTSAHIGLPSALFVTEDGRLLVGNAVEGRINVFTCDGRHVYDFDSLTLPSLLAPQALALDEVRDPDMQDSSSFDPSGVRQMGRFHVVDGNNGKIHMFGSLGKYIGSYPDDSLLVRPAGIAVNRRSNSIYVADPVARRLHIFTYRDRD